MSRKKIFNDVSKFMLFNMLILFVLKCFFRVAASLLLPFVVCSVVFICILTRSTWYKLANPLRSWNDISHFPVIMLLLMPSHCWAPRLSSLIWFFVYHNMYMGLKHKENEWVACICFKVVNSTFFNWNFFMNLSSRILIFKRCFFCSIYTELIIWFP